MVAQGNDFVDYYLSQDSNDVHVINRWKFNVGGPFALTIISIISASLCVLCSLSCFYNYRIHHGQGPPFIAPSFCPECLFPSVEQNQ